MDNCITCDKVELELSKKSANRLAVDAQVRDFLLRADSYLLLTLQGESPKAAGHADDLDQLLMLVQYLNTRPQLMRALRALLSQSSQPRGQGRRGVD